MVLVVQERGNGDGQVKTREAVKLLTGFTDAELDDLGGFDDETRTGDPEVITPQDWSAVDRQTYSTEEQQAIDAFITENGKHYDRVIDALQDYQQR